MTADQPNPQAALDAPRYEVPTDLAWIDGSEHGHEGDLYLTKVPDGKTVLLRGSSRLIWLAAIESANPLAEIAASVGVPADQIAEDVSAFLAELASNGLLTVR